MKVADASKTQVLVAVIGLTGVLGTAMIANWDKLFGDRQVAAVAGDREKASAPPAEATKTAEQVADIAAAQSTALKAEAARDEEEPETAGEAAVPDISGRWQDAQGMVYLVEQAGADYIYGQYYQNQLVQAGQGRISGSSFQAQSKGMLGEGVCEGEVRSDLITGTCRNWEGSAAVRLTR
jgi:hypothetical protein